MSPDTNKFGYKLLSSMGWAPGKGLGINEDGGQEHIKIRLKENNYGVGANKKNADNWLDNSSAFTKLLQELNERIEVGKDGKDGNESEDRNEGKSRNERKSRNESESDEDIFRKKRAKIVMSGDEMEKAEMKKSKKIKKRKSERKKLTKKTTQSESYSELELRKASSKTSSVASESNHPDAATIRLA